MVLRGTPKSHGLLKIVGYATTVLGLRNQCKLRTVLPALASPFYSVDVVPALPRLTIRVMSPTQFVDVRLVTSLPALVTDDLSVDGCRVPTGAEADGVAAMSALQLYAGQSTECYVSLVNDSQVAVECFDMELVHANRSPFGDVFSFRSASRLI